LQTMTRSDTPENILNRPIAQEHQWIEMVTLLYTSDITSLQHNNEQPYTPWIFDLSFHL